MPDATGKESPALEWYLLDLTYVVNHHDGKRNSQLYDIIAVLEGCRERCQPALPHKNQQEELVLENPLEVMAGRRVGGLPQSTSRCGWV